MDNYHWILLPQMHTKSWYSLCRVTRKFCSTRVLQLHAKQWKMYDALTSFSFWQCLPSSCFVEISYLHNFNSFLSSFLSSKLTKQWCCLFTFHLLCALITYRLGASADIFDPFQVEMITERGPRNECLWTNVSSTEPDVLVIIRTHNPLSISKQQVHMHNYISTWTWKSTLYLCDKTHELKSDLS